MCVNVQSIFILNDCLFDANIVPVTWPLFLFQFISLCSIWMVKLPGGLFLFYSHGMFVCIEMRILKHEPYTPVVSEADGVEKEIEEIFS